MPNSFDLSNCDEKREQLGEFLDEFAVEFLVKFLDEFRLPSNFLGEFLDKLPDSISSRTSLDELLDVQMSSENRPYWTDRAPSIIEEQTKI